MTSESNKGKRFPTFSQGETSALPKTSIVQPEIEGYKIVDQLGEGGMGTVWRAMQVSTNREVAIKVTNAQVFGSKRALARFEREVELAARLEHPNIARIYDSGIHQKIYYYAMELIEGVPLDQYILEHQMKARQVVLLIHTICTAMQYAHQRGVIHRDLKPSNILVTADNQPHILDFGLAKDLLRDHSDQTVSLDGDILGTPAFMSPEQAAGKLQDIDTRSDIYSLGVILYNLLTNNWPYRISGTHYETLKAIREEYPQRPSVLTPSIESDLEAILLKALAKDPGERYQTAMELDDDIQSYLDGRPVKAQTANTWYILRKYIARHRVASLIVGLLLIIILCNAFIGIYSWYRASDSARELEQREQAYRKGRARDEELITQVALGIFLERWHADDPNAKALLPFLLKDSQVYAGIRFLDDPRPFEQKLKEISIEESSDKSFWQFIFGEQHLKDRNNKEAINAFSRCLRGRENIDDQRWYQNVAQTRLEGLMDQQKEVIHGDSSNIK